MIHAGWWTFQGLDLKEPSRLEHYFETHPTNCANYGGAESRGIEANAGTAKKSLPRAFMAADCQVKPKSHARAATRWLCRLLQLS